MTFINTIRILLISTNSLLSAVMFYSAIDHSDVVDMIPCETCGFFYGSIELYIFYSSVNGIIFLSITTLIILKKFQKLAVSLSILWPLALMYYAQS